MRVRGALKIIVAKFAGTKQWDGFVKRSNARLASPEERGVLLYAAQRDEA